MADVNADRILIVDDEEELMRALEAGLKGMRYDAVGFSSAKEALELLKVQEFDLLLTDMMMPEMDGLSLLKAALQIDPNLTAIVMTGQGTIQTAVDAIKSGAFDYVLKPFKLRTLLPVVERALEFRQVRLENIQLRESVAIYELSQVMAFTRDTKTILNKVTDAAVQQCQADEASIMLLAEEDNELEVVLVRGEGREHLKGERLALAQGIAGWVAKEQQPLMLDGEAKDERFQNLRPRSDLGSSISMPMLAGGKLIGVLNLACKAARRFP
ncbi:MAG: response regulator, partial [Planctomycetota bacterium]|nr:response regulator [Planctomycetota bacterium]